ncbi:MAG: hypothetical protein M0Z51_13205 [Propionibacterium sp.]|nr:hypothetical protein [Propionibacterium sp.]
MTLSRHSRTNSSSPVSRLPIMASAIRSWKASWIPLSRAISPC